MDRLVSHDHGRARAKGVVDLMREYISNANLSNCERLAQIAFGWRACQARIRDRDRQPARRRPIRQHRAGAVARALQQHIGLRAAQRLTADDDVGAADLHAVAQHHDLAVMRTQHDGQRPVGRAVRHPLVPAHIGGNHRLAQRPRGRVHRREPAGRTDFRRMRGFVRDHHGHAVRRRAEQFFRKGIRQTHAAVRGGIAGHFAGMQRDAAPRQPLHERHRRVVV